MPHFQLVTTDGDVLGARELGRPDWPPGSVIELNDHPAPAEALEGERRIA